MLAEAAALLRKASRERLAIEPLTSQYPSLTETDAWQIQSINRDLAIREGRSLTGFKVGLTSAAMQEQMGVGEPDFGILLTDMAIPDGGVLRLADFVQPRVEAEVALVLGTDLGRGCTAADVSAATAAVVPALEIIDSRIRDWQLTLADTVADNASSGAYVLGNPTGPDGLDLPAVEVIVEVNGSEQARGLGSAALGGPLAAAAWLAGRLGDLGETLRAGSVILTGSLHASLPLQPGDDIRADFGALGAVRLRVS
jgi:2-keto-4-pentenoate hydratase